MANYYLFDRNSDPGRWIDDSEGDIDNTPEVDWYYWRRGALIPKSETISKPIKFTLKPMSEWAADHSPHMPSYLRAAAPIFSEALIDVLYNSGVDNIEVYDVVIHDPDNGKTFTNYKAVNIVGLLSVADMDKSDVTIHPNGPAIIDVDFDGLVIDDEKARGQLFFRLAESTNAIIAHDRVKQNILKSGITDLAFYETEKVAL